MRTYPLNSPHAAARIVALTLVSDGQLKNAELDALEAVHAHERLGLSRDELRWVVHGFCADLLADAQWRGDDDCHIEPETIERLLGEVDQRQLRRTVLQLCVAVVHADREVHEGESVVLLAAMEHWGLRPEAINLLGAKH